MEVLAIVLGPAHHLQLAGDLGPDWVPAKCMMITDTSLEQSPCDEQTVVKYNFVMHVWLLPSEDFGGVVNVEPRQVLGGEQRSSISVWGCKHRSQEATGASSSNDIEVVCNPSIWPIQFLHIGTAQWMDSGDTIPDINETLDELIS
jgi:hypothetical protein